MLKFRYFILVCIILCPIFGTGEGCMDEILVTCKEAAGTLYMNGMSDYIDSQALPTSDCINRNCEKSLSFVNCSIEESKRLCPADDEFINYFYGSARELYILCEDNTKTQKIYQAHDACVKENPVYVRKCRRDLRSFFLENLPDSDADACAKFKMEKQLCTLDFLEKQCGAEVHQFVKELLDANSYNEFQYGCNEELEEEAEKLYKDLRTTYEAQKAEK